MKELKISKFVLDELYEEAIIKWSNIVDLIKKKYIRKALSKAEEPCSFCIYSDEHKNENILIPCNVCPIPKYICNERIGIHIRKTILDKFFSAKTIKKYLKHAKKMVKALEKQRNKLDEYINKKMNTTIEMNPDLKQKMDSLFKFVLPSAPYENDNIIHYEDGTTATIEEHFERIDKLSDVLEEIWVKAKELDQNV